MTSRPKTVWVGATPVTPTTAKERRRIDKRVKKRQEKLRKRFKEIRGKRVDWIDHNYEEGRLYIGIRFMDKTYFSLQFSTRIVTDGIDFSDVKTGDSKILRRDAPRDRYPISCYAGAKELNPNSACRPVQYPCS